MYEIFIGRNSEDREKFGEKGTFMLGRNYVKMGQTSSLSNKVMMDVARSHVVFVTGKRGSGKSYTMASLAEGMMELPEDVTSKIAIVMFDTMGIYWTMKYENRQDQALLADWKLKYRKFNSKIFVPTGYFEESREKGIPVDAAFSIKPSELTTADWCSAFDLDHHSPIGALIGRIVSQFKGENFDLDDMIEEVRSDSRSSDSTKAALENLFFTAKDWGLFSKEGFAFSELVAPSQISIIDVSGYASSVGRASVRALVIGLVSKKLFSERMIVRKAEEYKNVRSSTSILEFDKPAKKEMQ